MDKKRTVWIQKRHRIVRNIACALLRPYCRWKYGISPEPFLEQGDRAYLILANHQTPFDQFFIGISFQGPVYYMATEDIFSKGWISSLIRWLVAPIPIKKQTNDINAVKTCIKVAREGGTIAIFPEGNRTYSGKTEYMKSSIGGLAKRLKLPIALYRIEGGYGVQPRWSDGVRKGKMRSFVSRVIEPEEYSALSNDELFSLIQEELMVNEGKQDGLYRSDKRAEYLERAMYVCPFCGLSEFESHGNEAQCLKCHRKVIYGEDKRVSGVGFDFPFSYMTEWYDYQQEYVSSLDTLSDTSVPLYRDKANLSQVLVYERKVPLREQADLALYGDRLVIDEGTANALVLPFSELSALSVLGRNKLNIYSGSQVYQLKGSKRFNALKYVNLYYHYHNVSKGDNHGKFLGL